MRKSDLVVKKFEELFGYEPLVVKSPGRINLLGEHIDYNDGFVLPAAIDKYIYMAAGVRQDNEIHLFSVDYNDLHISDIHLLQPSGKLWPDYILGVVAELNKNYPINGFNIVFTGDIPEGAGLSSSAALECAAVYTLNELFSLNLEKLDTALVAQSAEHNFIGVRCGLMDQFASVFGREGYFIQLDCRDHSFNYIPFTSTEYKIVLFDTSVKHSLASSAYNERREQCEIGLKMIRSHHSQVKSFRDVSQDMLVQCVKPFDEIVFKRCQYVIAEIKRVQLVCEDLQRNDFISCGKRMFETHEGLKNLYEVSCPELDYLIDEVLAYREVIGARMMGGGFGGCTINLIKVSEVDKVIEAVSVSYKLFTGSELKVYEVKIGEGTSRVDEIKSVL